MLERISSIDQATPAPELVREMSIAGFELGWGNTAGRIAESMQILFDLLNDGPMTRCWSPSYGGSPCRSFSRIAIISPTRLVRAGQGARQARHGRAGHLHSRPGPRPRAPSGRVDQAYGDRRPAAHRRDNAPDPGGGRHHLHVRLEKIYHTENAWILRVPFRERDLSVAPGWISRFHVWPYLERFAGDAITELTGEFEGRRTSL